MSSNSFCRCWGLLTFAVMALASSRASADDGVKSKVSPFLTIDFSNLDANLELGPDFKFGSSSNGVRLRVLADLPFTGDKKDHLAQLDRHTASWQIGGLLEYTHDVTSASGPIGAFRIGGEGKWGRSPFDYYPIGAAKQTVTPDSFSAALRVWGYWDQARVHGFKFAPQVKAVYAKDWKAPDAVAVLGDVNGTVSLPRTIPVQVVDPPTARATMDLRVAFITNIPRTDCFGLGPSVRYTMVGEKGHNNPIDGYRRVRLEFWGYYFPVVSDLPNVRVGLSPFVDIRVWERAEGEDKADSVLYGALLQLRIGTMPFEY